MTLKVLVNNTSKFNSAIKSLGAKVFVGVPSKSDPRADGGIGNADLAYIHEKGSPARNIPARPFMEPGIRSAQGAIESALQVGAASAFTNPSAVNTALNKSGLLAQVAIKKTIVAGPGFAALKESTVKARKRRGLTRTKPLIDTGSLLNSITYVVNNGADRRN